MLVKILRNYENAEGWKAGDVVDVTNADLLIRQGYVARIDPETMEIISEDRSKAAEFIKQMGRGETMRLVIEIVKRMDVNELTPLLEVLNKKIEAEAPKPKKVEEKTETTSKTKKK